MSPVRADGGPTRWRLLGLAGSTLLAAGAAGAGVLPRPDPLRHAAVLESLRHGPGRVLCIGLAALGMLALVAAWLLLGRCLDRTTPRGLCLTAALWSLPMVLAPPILSRDVYGYAVAGQMLQAGLNPYHHGAADLASSWVPSTSTSWLQVPLAYGPLFLLLARLVVATAGGSLTVALLGLRLVAIAGTIMLAWGLPRIARNCGVDERTALWLGLANPLVLAHFVGGAHADALMVGLLVAGLALAAGRRPVGWAGPVAGAVACGLAAAVKATALVALPFLALLWADRLRNRPAALARALAGVASAAGVAFVVVTAVSGVGYGWAGTLNTVGLTRQWTSLSTGLGLVAAGLAHAVGLQVATSSALAVSRGIASLLTLAVLAALWVRAARAGGHRLVVEYCGWALLAVVVLGPAVHPWYVTWPVAALAASGLTGRPRTAIVAASAALCFLVLPDGYNLARATLPIGLAIDVLVAAGLIVLAVRRLRGPRSSEQVTA